MPRSSAALALLAGIALLISGCSTERDVNYGMNHYYMGLYDRAYGPLQSAAKSLEKADPPDPRLPRVLMALGTMEMNRDPAKAEDSFRGALRAAEALPAPNDTAVRSALNQLGLFYARRKRGADGLAFLERAAVLSERGPDPVEHAIDLDNIGFVLQDLGRHAESNAMSAKALSVLDSAPHGPLENKARGIIMYNLARSYEGQNRYPEALARYRQSCDLLQAGSPQDVERWRVRLALQSHASLLRKMGREEEAAAEEKKAEEIR